MKAILYGVLCLFIALPVAAQVGHDPAHSPYTDLEYKQELTPLFGYDRARTDPAGILPQSAAMVGLRYEIYLAGPASFSADVSRSFATRNVVNPFPIASKRAVGTQSADVYAADIALVLGLAGRKSWHNLAPQLRGGVGIVGSRAKDDSSGYAFGTPFAFTFGGGLKFVPGGRFQMRADLSERVFKQRYPDSYYRLATDNTAVLDERTKRSFYTHHTALTVGVSYLFSH